MRYGLVSSPVLGFDLARHARGAVLARVLRYGVGAAAKHVVALAGAGRSAAADRAAALRRSREAAGGSEGGLDLARVALAAGDTDSAVRLLETGLLGGLESLLHFVDEQVRTECWSRATAVVPLDGASSSTPVQALDAATHRAAAEVLADAVVGAWADEPLLLQPFRRVALAVPRPPVQVGGQTAVVRRALGRLERLTAADRERLVEVSRDGPACAGGAMGTWARAVHEASWAVHATGRTEAAACVQLEAVAAVRSAGVDVPALAQGAWNLVSGALHALVVADVLPVDAALLAPWTAALGPLPHGEDLPRDG